MSRKTKIGLVALIIIAWAVFGWGLSSSQGKANTKPANSPCSNGSAPCIAILNESGQVFAKTNDFRFGPQGCIYYLSSAQWLEHCGGYTMQWIGPKAKAPSNTGSATI